MERFLITSDVDASALQAYRWAVDQAHGCVQIVHGLAEHAQRYDWLAQRFNAVGWEVWAHDHRLHGASVSAGEPAPNTWQALVADVAQVSHLIAGARPGLPLCLLGQSMGSIACQLVVQDPPVRYAALILAGSTAVDIFAAQIAATGPVEDLSSLNGGFNGPTGFEWLSRDQSEVKAYVADPLCGAPPDAALMAGLITAGLEAADVALLARVSSDLPILLISGDADPLAGGGTLIELLAERYKKAGVRNVETHLYAGARHELFRETNRNEVVGDMLWWLKRRGQPLCEQSLARLIHETEAPGFLNGDALS